VSPSLLEVAGFVTGVLAVWLTTRQVLWCWPLGIVNVALYAVVFYQAKLYADMGLQVVYAVLCAYGWWSWARGERGGALPVRRLGRPGALAALAAGGLATVGLGATLASTTDASLPWLDAGTASFSLVAQFLQARKRIENWLLWIAVDAVYIGMYGYKELWLTAALYLLFLLLAIAGWRSWRASLATSPEAPAGHPSPATAATP
jgi:nicotinamide mononucleotide transporter